MARRISVGTLRNGGTVSVEKLDIATSMGRYDSCD